MSRTVGLLLLVAAFLAAAMPSAALARRLSITATNLRFEGRWAVISPAGTVECPITLRGEIFGGIISKMPNTAIGRVNVVEIGECVGGTIRPKPNSLPWTKRYHDFSGLLPNITAINGDIDTRWIIRYFSLEIECEYGAGSEGTFNGPTITQFRLDESASKRSETIFCPEVRERGTLAISPSIRLTLV
jgi:hypothetical protein